MKLWAAALAMTMFMVGPARAQLSLPDGIPQVPAGKTVCDERACIVNRVDAEALHGTLERQAAAIQELEQRAERQAAYIERLEGRLNLCHPPARLQVLPPGSARS